MILERMDEMVTLYITRHGQTEWNVQQRIQGWFDSPLTAYGKEQAQALCKRLAKTPFTAAYSSPSGRALDTAKFILEGHQTPIFIKHELKEINVAEWQGMTLDKIAEKFPVQYDDYFYHAERFRSTEGEDFFDVQARAQKLIEKLESKYTAEDNILIVTHSIVKKVLINAFLQQPMDQLWTSPEIEGTSLTIVKLENGQATVEMCGDIEHMPPKNIFTN